MGKSTLFGLVLFSSMIFSSCFSDREVVASQEVLLLRDYAEKRASEYEVVIVTSDLQSRDFSCDPGIFDPLNCLDDVVITQSVIFEDCFLEVSYTQRVCFRLGEYEVNFWDLDVSYDDPSCEALSSELSQLQASGDYQAFKDKVEEIYSFASLDVEMRQMALYVQFGIPVNCDDPLTSINASFFAADCETYCFQYQIPEGRTILITSCGESCCKRTTRYCVDDETGEIVTQLVSKVNLSGECSPPTNLQCVGFPSEFGSPVTCSNPCNRL